MINLTNEIALITAVSDLRMFLDTVNGLVVELPSIVSRSEGEKSPSGPIKMHKDLLLLKSSTLRLSLELTSANNSLVASSQFFIQSGNFIVWEIIGGVN